MVILCNITKETFFIKKFYEKYGLETSSRPFLMFKESSVKRNLRRSVCWFGEILIVLPIQMKYKQLASKIYFPIEIMLDSSQTQKGLERVSRLQILQNFLIFFFLCIMTSTGQISLTGCVYFPSYSVKFVLCFMLIHLMTSWNFDFLKNEKSF